MAAADTLAIEDVLGVLVRYLGAPRDPTPLWADPQLDAFSQRRT